MNRTNPFEPGQNSGFDRTSFLTLLDTALQVKSWRFARQAALLWLAVYPGDLEVRLRLALAQSGEGRTAAAISLMEELVGLDPEFGEAQKCLGEEYFRSGQPEKAGLAWALAAILGNAKADTQLPGWAQQLLGAYNSFKAGDFATAENQVHGVLGEQPDLMLAAVLHMRLTRASGDARTVNRLASIYHERWPEPLIFSLALAEAQMELGDETRAVAMLHQCVARDSSGQIARRLWGAKHRYQPLWPERMTAHFELVIPAEVAAPLGLNQLPKGVPAGEVSPAASPADQTNPSAEPIAAETVDYSALNEAEATQVMESKAARIRRGMQADEVARDAEESFDRIAKKIKRPGLSKVDGRFPLYVIFSTRKGMEKQYGPQTAAALENEMRKLAAAVAKRPGWGSLVYFPDDAVMTGKLGLKPTDAIDPWKLKLALVDLDQALAKKGQRIGIVLIVGGPDVVPFHKLPNPTDDTDPEVISDNPYTTLDSNYFIPEWPVGRLPGEIGPDAGLLMDQLRKAIAYHASQAYQPLRWWMQTWMFLRRLQPKSKKAAPRPPFGMTAAAWQRSSSEVWKLNGDKRTLVVCPPEGTETVDPVEVSAASLGYFNLHGVEDGAEWYGQRDPADQTPGADYPVALSPHNLIKNGTAPKVVFSEACYGGLVAGKREAEAISLRFLAIGTHAVVGSTCVSYGSVAAPLIGADLLGSLFWKHLQAGMTAGEALMQAKIDTVREMNRRQGFLDGEDQKTLLSFVLYGDPLVSLAGFQKGIKSLPRFRSHPKVPIISDKPQGDLVENDLTDETMQVVKRVLEPFLPGFSAEDISVTHQQVNLAAHGRRHPAASASGKEGNPQGSERMVVSVSKQVQIGSRRHQRFARLTFNARGKVVKMAISR